MESCLSAETGPQSFNSHLSDQRTQPGQPIIQIQKISFRKDPHVSENDKPRPQFPCGGLSRGNRMAGLTPGPTFTTRRYVRGDGNRRMFYRNIPTNTVVFPSAGKKMKE